VTSIAGIVNVNALSIRRAGAKSKIRRNDGLAKAPENRSNTRSISL